MSDSLQPHGLLAARLLCPWNSLGKNTGVGNHFLLQGIFLTQGSNLGLLFCRQILYHLSHQGVGNQTVKLQEFLLVARAFAGHLVCSSVNWAPALWSALPKAPGTRCG